MVTCVKCSKIALIVGAILVSLIIGSYFGINQFLKVQIHKRLILKDNTTFYNWLNPPAVVYRKYYLFSVSNPDEVQKGLEKAKLVQLGPYVYREVLEKRNPKFHDDDKITYSPVSVLYFESNLSNGSLDDLVIFPNVPAVAMIEDATRTGVAFLMAGMFQIFNVKLFISKTVNELITGYNDPLLNLGRMADPSKVKSNQFSLLNGRNNTINHNVTIYIGSDSTDNIGRVHAVNGLTKLSVWPSDHANTFKGSDGIMYPPYVKREKDFYTYNVEMCRPLKYTYLEDKIIDGVEAYDFHLPKDVFYNSTFNPENEGYCSGNDCLGNGVFNLSRCLGGISMFGSLPHFLNAEKKILDFVDGLSPNEEEHDYRLSLHPLTGAPIKAKARFQLSLYIPNNPSLELVKNVKPFLLPMFWIEVDADVLLDTKKQLNELTQFINLVSLAQLIAFLIGSLVLIISIITLCVLRLKAKKISKGKAYSLVKTNLNNLS